MDLPAFTKQYTSLKGCLCAILREAGKRSKLRKSRGRIEAAECAITASDLNHIWKAQNGCCYYSGVPMNFDKNEFRPSLERIDDAKGYILSNIVLCCAELNISIQWTSAKIYYMIEKCAKDLSSTSPSVESHTESHLKRVLHVCIRNAARHTQVDLKRNNTHRSNKFDIDLEYLEDLYLQQKGRCAYSGITMCFQKDHWNMTLAKKDPFQGYKRGNVILICSEFRGSNHANHTINTECGHAGWTREKFRYFLAHARHKYNYTTSEKFNQEVQASGFQPAKSYTDFVQAHKNLAIKPSGKTMPLRNKIAKITPEMTKKFSQLYLITMPSNKRYIGHIRPDIIPLTFSRIYALSKRVASVRDFELVDDEYQALFEEQDIIVTPLLICKVDDIDTYKDMLIHRYNTYTPNGLNKLPQTVKYHISEEQRKNIRNKLIERVKRYNHRGEELPKYVKFLDWADRKGYSITSHPRCKKKDFVSSRETLDNLYAKCIEYLQSLEDSE